MPTLAMVSTDIRRDLLAPLRHFTQFDLVHLYRRAPYADLMPDDLMPNLQHYASPRELYDRLVHARPDVIQGVEPFSLALQPYLWACYLAARRTGARLLVVTPENRPLDIKFNLVLALILRQALRVYFNRACRIIVLNEGARRNVLECAVDPARVEKLMWGTWGVDLDEFSPLPHPAGPPTILFAGRLHPEKGIFVLLDAFARTRAARPDVRLMIVGDGPARRQVESRVAEMTGVELRGAVKNREMPDLFRAADVVAMPSRTTRKWEEQVGMVALQAMACGVPVVASRSGAIPEYVSDGVAGLLVPENDAAALAGCLIKILSEASLREKLGRGARAYALEHYDARVNMTRAQAALRAWLEVQ